MNEVAGPLVKWCWEDGYLDADQARITVADGLASLRQSDQILVGALIAGLIGLLLLVLVIRPARRSPAPGLATRAARAGTATLAGVVIVVTAALTVPGPESVTLTAYIVTATMYVGVGLLAVLAVYLLHRYLNRPPQWLPTVPALAASLLTCYVLVALLLDLDTASHMNDLLGCRS